MKKKNTFAKRQKEIAKKQKAAEKMERRRAKTDLNTDSDAVDATMET